MPRRLLPVVILFAATACLGRPATLAPCDGWEPERAICNLMNPEDLAPLAGRDWVIVSEMARVDPGAEPGRSLEIPGRLTALRVSDRTPRPLFPTRKALAPLSEWSAAAVAEPESAMPVRSDGWGDEACPGAPQAKLFQPHGVDVGRGPGGRPTLAVVNHGGREAVELFEIVGLAEPDLEWRGCVPMPPGILTNDVALLADGGFVVTHFMPALEGIGPKTIWTLLKIAVGGHTGEVLRWQPGQPVSVVPGSQGSAPNGIAVAPDGRTVFVAEWGGKAIYRIFLAEDGGVERDEVALGHNPDNLTWTWDGRLLVAGQHGGPMKVLGCGEIREGGCDIGYSVYVVDPVDLEPIRVLVGRGAVSVALEVENEILVGAFAGDQIIRVPIGD
ncbi:MAG: hypothetical protein CL908_01940 [Deltaproteobacteria bacterium]|nr:hypothetical protein [Deltaproteobacteria bacterium]